MNIEEAKALIGKTFGSGKDQRTVTRIEQLKTGSWTGKPYTTGYVYWKRPGGKERQQSKWLPYFVKWMNKAERGVAQTAVTSIEEVELYLSEIPEATELDGFITRKDDEVTIVFTIK